MAAKQRRDVAAMSLTDYEGHMTPNNLINQKILLPITARPSDYYITPFA
jgi:hypothetical protein